MQWLMLQLDKPDDFVIASGRMESVRKFCELTANELGWNKGGNSSGIYWENKDLDEIGRRADTGEIVIRIDPRYYRPTEVNELMGDASKAEKKLGWKPKISLEMLISEMVAAEKKYYEGAPLNSVEGFIRQILGWREFIRGIYWLKMPDYKS